MAEIVFAGAMSHSPLMYVPGVDGGPGASTYREAAARLAEDLGAARPDCVVLFFPDHFRMAHYDNMPAFCLGVRHLSTCGDWYLPRLDLAVDEALAAWLLDAVPAEGFDLAYSADMRIDHGGAQALHLLGLEALPVVPFFVNCAAPPLPSLARSAALGAAVGRALDAFPDGRRIAVLGSGGLSHQVPLPAWNDLDPSDGEKYRTFVTGLSPEEMEKVEGLRIERVVSMLGTAETWTDEELDRQVLADLLGGRLEAVTGRSQSELVTRGGTGMNEVRTWLAAYAAAGAVGGELYGYATVGNWLTGMGVVRYHRREGASR